MTKLAFLAVAPGVRIAPTVNVGRMLISTRDIHYLALRGGDCDLLRLNLFERVNPEAELAIRVLTEAPQLAIGVEDECVVGSTFDADRV